MGCKMGKKVIYLIFMMDKNVRGIVMKMIIKIFRKDIKGLLRNFFACVIAIGLCIIPSLYAWFNIYSNWDPYANTS